MPHWLIAIFLSAMVALCSLIYIQRAEIGTLEEKLRASMSLVQEYEVSTAKLKAAYQEKVKQMEGMCVRGTKREKAIQENRDALSSPIPDDFRGLF